MNLKLLTHSQLRRSFILAVLLIASAQLFAQPCTMSGVYKVGHLGDFNSITKAVDSLRKTGIGGIVILELKAGYKDTAETFPLTFKNIPCIGASQYVLIRPETGATGLLISSSNTTATINLDSARYIRFDGRPGGIGTTKQLAIANTSTAASVFRFINDASYNRLDYINVTGRSTSTTIGILSFLTSNQTITSGNSFNVVSNCQVGDVAFTVTNSIYSAGTTGRKNTANFIENSTIINYNLVSGTANGILLGANNSAWEIKGNSIYQTGGLSSYGSSNGISINDTTSFGFDVRDNFIGGSVSGNGGVSNLFVGNFSGIRIFASSKGVSSIQNNSISNIRYKTSVSSNYFAGILIGNGKVHCGNITGNIIGSQTTYGNIVATASHLVNPVISAILTGSLDSYSEIDTVLIRNNIIGGIRTTFEGTALGTDLNVIFVKDQLKGYVDISNNSIGSATVVNSLHNANTSENKVNGIKTTTSGGGYIPQNRISGNTITNLLGLVKGMEISGGKNTISNNTISKLYSDQIFNSIMGIQLIGSKPGTVVSGNTLHTFTTKTTSEATIFGITTLFGESYTIAKNLIHTLQPTANTSGNVIGIDAQGLNHSVHNNMVRLGLDSIGGSITKSIQFIGIRSYVDSSSILHNSVYMGGTGGMESHAASIHASGSKKNRITNNIFVNNRVSTNPTSFPNFCIKLSNIPDTVGMTLNHNIYHTTASGAFISSWKNVRYSAIIPWRTAIGLDSNSMFYNPNFIMPEGNVSTIDLHLANPNPAEGAGKAEPGITEDFDGETRSLLTPVDIGADAGNFVYQDGDAPVITHEAFLGQPIPSAFVYKIKITDNGLGLDTLSGNKPRMWFRKKFPTTSAWFSNAGNFISGNLFEGQWGFTPDFAGAGLTLNPGDSVQYYFVAQDKGTIANVGYSNITGVKHNSVMSQVTAPTTPLRLLIYGNFPNTVFVGAGQTYTSLTNNDGFFHAAKKNLFDSLSPAVNVIITSNLTEDGTHWYTTLNSNKVAISIGTNTPTIKQIRSNGTISTSLIGLENVSNVIFDGRVNGTGRYLQFVNSSTSPAFTESVFRIYESANKLEINSCIIESNASNFIMPALNLAGNNVRRLMVTNNLIREVQGGPAGLPNIGIRISNNNENDSIIIRNNDITNFSGIGIELAQTTQDFSNSPTFLIDSNHLYYTTTYIQAGERWGIMISNGSGHAFVTDNFIGGTNKNCGGTPWNAKYTMTGISVVNSTNAYINGNTINNFRLTDIGAKFTGINLGTGTASVGNLKPNIIGSTTIDSGIVTKDIFTGIKGYVNIFSSSSPLTTIENNIIAGNLGDRFLGLDIQCRMGNINNNTIYNNKAYEGNSSIQSGFSAMKIWMDSGRIEKNKIYRIYNNAGAGSSSYGMEVQALNAVIARNKIYKLGSAGSNGTELAGIWLAGGEYNVQNNQLDINNENGTSTTKVYGLFVKGSIDPGFESRINYNTIHISGTTTGTTASYAAFMESGAPTRSFKNNLLYNERTSGTTKHLALGMTSLSTNPPLWNGSGANNNLYITKDTALVNEWKTNGSVNIRTWRSLSQGDSASYSALVSDIPSVNLFQSTATGDLNINTTNPLCWYVNGKGLPVPGITADYDSTNIRSVHISNGPTDIGAHEFNTATIPPSLLVYGKHILGGADTLSFNGRIMAIITWGSTGTLPTLGDCRWFSGQWPNDTTNNGNISNARFMSGFLDIPATGGSGYTYSLTMYYDSAMLGKILTQSTMIINRKQSNVAGSWVRIIPSLVNTSLKTITVNNQSSFSEFTATDVAAPLPVYVTAFTATAANKDVQVKWKVAPADEERFIVERSFEGIAFTGIATIATNTAAGGSYTYTDAGILAMHNIKTVYYRLNSISRTGETSYSGIAIVKVNEAKNMITKVLPNPFTNVLSVEVNIDKAQPVTFTMFDLTGKTTFTFTMQMQLGTQAITIHQAAKLPSGQYTLVVQVDGNSSSTKLLKL